MPQRSVSVTPGAGREAVSKRYCAGVRPPTAPLRRGTEPGPIRTILTHLGESLEPPPVSPAGGPPIDWGKLVQTHDDREAVQVSPDELPVIDIHSL